MTVKSRRTLLCAGLQAGQLSMRGHKHRCLQKPVQSDASSQSGAALVSSWQPEDYR